ncbi:MAG: Cys-tRNA(Pro) deacylase [Sporolactobacillus sp.]
MTKNKVKTNAMRFLDREKMSYAVQTYSIEDGLIDGLSVAEKCGEDPAYVFKTLVTRGHSGALYVYVIPVAEELDLKKAAAAVGEKKVDMLAVKELLVNTGYVRGGCSPIGMKKHYHTVIDDAARTLDHMVVSGGKKGVQISLAPDALARTAQAEFNSVTH